ncbi:MAG: asparaginase, partial [Acidobacteria bacterium]|nr:asparaginase [Acidobacteriota bacterium]
MMKPRIALFFTGGTISMRIENESGGAVPKLSGAEILAQVPGLDLIAELDVVDFARLPGPHWTPARMLELAQAVRAKLADVDGVVITHGTDTLEETAYALDLLIQSDQPVVFVGAMRNSSELSWDGPANVKAAVRVAAAPQARALGVLVVMNDELIAAGEVTKTHTEKTDTFQSRDFGALGIVDKDQVMIARRPARREYIETDAIEPRVEIIKMYAGADGKFIDFAVAEGVRGLVIEALGRGNGVTLPRPN